MEQKPGGSHQRNSPSPDPTRRPESPSGSATGLGAVAGVGFQFALSILLFLYVGQWVDERLGTAPLFLIVGVFVGAGAGFFAIYRTLMHVQRRDEERRRAGRPDA